ncbi:hypothetical protein [Nocardia sp. 348MFTsu5.1]|uniref:hypothetical protein n=1 Tax=Nocardia sp. 348MFTsu5.1 TaxID=1172185 RepID=UPI0009DBCD3A|nr:hypothetical protein [Nocardia sp. 348MFTsu5.1]
MSAPPIRAAAPHQRVFADLLNYHRSRPDQSSDATPVVTGIQEQEPELVTGDLLAEWDVLFVADLEGLPDKNLGDVIARRTLRRARHSRTTITTPDSHPIILLADGVSMSSVNDVWTHALLDHGATLSDVIHHYQQPQE